MTTTFQGRSLNRAAFQLYLDSLRDKVEKQIDEVSNRSPVRRDLDPYGDLVMDDDDDDDDVLEHEIERLYAQHRREASGRPGSAGRVKTAGRRRDMEVDPYASYQPHQQVQMIRPRSAHARPKKKKAAPDRQVMTARQTEKGAMSPEQMKAAWEATALGGDLANSDNTTVGTLEHQVSRQVFGGQSEGQVKKDMKKKARASSASRKAVEAREEPAAKPVPKRPGSAVPSRAKGGLGALLGRTQQKNVSALVRTVLTEVNSLEKDIVEKIKDLNEYCEKMKWERKYQPQYKSKVSGASRELFRVACVDTRNDVVLRDMSVELFIKDYRKVREIFKEWERMEESKKKQPSPRRRPSEIKKETHDDIRVVLLETVQLTKKLRDQVMEMERKGGNFSPYA